MEKNRKKYTHTHTHTHTYIAASLCCTNYMTVSLVAQTVKHLPAMQDTLVQSLGWEDPLEKEMATYFRTLAWKIPWTEELGSLQSVGLQRIRHT